MMDPNRPLFRNQDNKNNRQSDITSKQYQHVAFYLEEIYHFGLWSMIFIEAT